MKYCFIFFAALYTTAVTAQDVATANWAANPITIDGNPAEWHQPLSLYDTDTKLLFDMSNDSTHIYLCFESKDEQTQRKIMRAGMTVELSTKGHGKRTASIAFPLPPKERDSQAESGDNGDNTKDNSTSSASGNASDPGQASYRRQNQAMTRQRFLTDNLTMHLEGFATVNGVIPIQGREITAAMNWDSTNNLFYEIAIPIKQLIDNGYTAEELTKEITLHVEVNALAQRGGHGGGGGFGGGGGSFGGGGFGGGGGGFGGRGMRGGGFGGGGGNVDRSGMYKTTTFKQKFLLGAATAPSALAK